ncbi:MAG TPA: carbohydrate ABC transporter permease, partial [Candidatus Hodarchaeales archaeon]|nr:carbohydrate ABC transporter permease [Candidatus Hodarchaeales archaeon]
MTTTVKTSKNNVLRTTSLLGIPASSVRIFLSFLAVFGFIIQMGGFWSMQTIFWSRSIYNVGQWQSSLPIYREHSLAQLSRDLAGFSSAYQLGAVSFVIGSSLIILLVYMARPVNRKALGAITGAAVLSAVMAYWNIGALAVTNPACRNNLNIECPTEWVRQGLPAFASGFESASLLLLLLFAAYVVTSFFLLLFLIWRERTSEESKLRRATEVERTGLFEMVLFYLVLIFYLVITLIPVFLTVVVSLSSTGDLTRYQQIGNRDPFPIPTDFLNSFVLNYSSVLFVIGEGSSSFTSAFAVTLVLAVGTASLGLATSLTSAYAMARFKFWGKNKFVFSLVAIQMFPGIILLIPQFLIWKQLGLLDPGTVLFGVLLAFTVGALGYCAWMMKGYFETLPKDLEEAALIDGSTTFDTFLKIAVPLAKPGMVAVFLFTFLTAWNEFVLVRTFIGEN